MAICAYKNKFPKIAERVFIDESAKVIGDVIIGKDSSVWPMATIRGDVNRIEIGERTNIQDGCVLHGSPSCDFYAEGYTLVLGNDITIGHNVTLHGCTIRDNCLIGMGAIVLDGAEIAEGVIIAAGSLVPHNKKLESGYVYVGSPVKKARELNKVEKKLFSYSSACYVKLKDDFMQK
ncbi:MAG: gamma carbonic anhydrase family protein [Gammaproteobacteria bacterium]|jgi:carbonic anhydrase/acetyltransferase-like protein (isoleucine patch superfamily)